MMQTFEDLYSSYCDCGKFIKWLDEDRYLKETKTEGSSEEDSKPFAWFVTRGAEMCDMGDGICKFFWARYMLTRPIILDILTFHT
jgi:hypothetical protein